MTSLEQVKQLHETFGHPVFHCPPNQFDSSICKLRIDLLREELNELEDSLVLSFQDPNWPDKIIEEKDSILDALCDLQVILDGAFLALGFWRIKDEAMAEVHRSNMSKLGADGKPIFRADGKFLKGPNYSPPNLKPLIEKLYA